MAEFIGAAAAVFGIDHLIQRRDKTRLLPVLASSYEDVRLMTHWALDLWRGAYESSIPDSVPASWEELFSKRSLEKIGASLDIDKPATVYPPLPWATYFDIESERIQKHAERVLERHGFMLDPEVHNAVYTMIYYGGHKISRIAGIDRHAQVPRPRNLGSYVPMITAWFEAVLTLHAWTEKTYKHLVRHEVPNVHGPYLFRPLEVRDSPAAAFDPGALEAQVEAFQKWQSSQR